MIARLFFVVAVTWTTLIVSFLAPSALPSAWQYYVYSPASVGLWLLAVLFAPLIAVAVKWPWIKHG
ncbi:hypothetical protein [Streptomyces longisporoflavus]|uniref:hypothetical protein n=1 Tax=Streptomyces longisporoflavus TaxID=28044 RepID=UPI00167D5637|nr:hypothetical protein [Streptomyces longisporoflavus]